MSSPKQISTSIEELQAKMNLAIEKINEANAIVIGGGAGLSAAGGLDYNSEELTKELFPQYVRQGMKTIPYIQTKFWTVDHTTLEEYWAYWSKHILYMRHNFPATEPYKYLYDYIKDRNYFIITTNVDHQFYKAGFDEDKIFAMQGDYGTLQCEKNCQNKVYDNKEIFEKMQANMPDEYHIRTEDIPYCPDCGARMIINFRMPDNEQSQARHMKNSQKYIDFVNENAKGKIVFLELGIGYNTPGVIRYPFEDSTKIIPNAFLARINKIDTRLPAQIIDKAVVVDMDILEFLKTLDSQKK